MTEPSAQGDARAEVAALRRLAMEYDDVAVASTISRSDCQLIADALSFKADVLAQDAALVERMAQAIARRRYGLPNDVVRVQESECETARAALAAMLQKEQTDD